MAPRPAPRWCVALIRFVQAPHDGFLAVILAGGGALTAIMAILTIVQHQLGHG